MASTASSASSMARTLPAPEPRHWQDPGLLEHDRSVQSVPDRRGDRRRRHSARACSAGCSVRSRPAAWSPLLLWFFVGFAGGVGHRRRHRVRLSRCSAMHDVFRRAPAEAAAGRAAAAAAIRAAAVRATAADSAAAAAVSAAAARRGVGRAMGIKRIGRHLLDHRWRVRRIFPPAALAAYRAGDQGQRSHAFRANPLRRRRRAGRRAAVAQSAARGRGRSTFFRNLRIWDTAHNNGVLIYLLLADRDVEIRRRPRHRCESRHRRMGKNLPGDGSRIRQGKFRSRRDQGHRGGVAATGEAFSEARRRRRMNCRMRRW